MIALSSILYLLWIIIKTLFLLFLPILLIIILYEAYKIWKRKKEYGKSDFEVFKRRDPVPNTCDLLKNQLCQIDRNICFYKGNEYQSDLIAGTSFGILLINCIPSNLGHVEGTISEKELVTWKEVNKKVKMKNPFYYQIQDDEKIKQKGFHIPIRSYLILDTYTILNVEGTTKIECIRLEQFYYEMEKLKKREGIYSKEEINSWINKL